MTKKNIKKEVILTAALPTINENIKKKNKIKLIEYF